MHPRATGQRQVPQLDTRAARRTYGQRTRISGCAQGNKRSAKATCLGGNQIVAKKSHVMSHAFAILEGAFYHAFSSPQHVVDVFLWLFMF